MLVISHARDNIIVGFFCRTLSSNIKIGDSMKKIISMLIFSFLFFSAYAQSFERYAGKLSVGDPKYCEQFITVNAQFYTLIGPTIPIVLKSFNGHILNEKSKSSLANTYSFSLNSIPVVQIGKMRAKFYDASLISDEKKIDKLKFYVTLLNVDAPPFSQSCTYR